ncbi:MAG: hypothetical protein M3Z17_10855 [Gemmatimonadota bacterium]|nr:hypothetical protein [Gemmatimonadota bacterium]
MNSTDSVGVRLCVACKAETYAYSDLDRVEARVKVPGNHLWQGAGLGALVGIGVDILLTVQCYHDGRGNELVGLCGLGYLYAPVFGLGGGVVGGVAGAQVPRRAWVTVYRRRP